MKLKQENIKCDIFLDAEAVIKKTEVKAKEIRNAKEKQYYAQDILLEAKTLLSCSNYSPRSPDCTSCRAIVRRYIREYDYLAKVERSLKFLPLQR